MMVKEAGLGLPRGLRNQHQEAEDPWKQRQAAQRHLQGWGAGSQPRSLQTLSHTQDTEELCEPHLRGNKTPLAAVTADVTRRAWVLREMVVLLACAREAPTL